MGKHARAETLMVRIVTRCVTRETGWPGVPDRATPGWCGGTATGNSAIQGLRCVLALVLITL